MRCYSLCFCKLVMLAATAQQQLPTFYATDTVTITCPQDISQTILSYNGWEAYQTTNDIWFGPRDTTVCIDLAHITGNYVQPYIAYDDIDATRPVFLRVLYSDSVFLPLVRNDQYAIGIDLYCSSYLDTAACPGGPCTGLQAAVQIPDSTGLSTDLRWYQSTYMPDELSEYPLSVCVPTEKFLTNNLREFVVSMKAVSPQSGGRFNFYNTEVRDLAMFGNLTLLTDSVLPQYYYGNNNYGFSGGFFENFLVLHPDTIYPNANHLGYLNFSPIPNVTDPTTVMVMLDPFTGFNFQPFAQLRGGTVLGSDSVRHPLTVINNGADLCLGFQFVEVFWNDGDHYIHQGGHLDFGGYSSCFMFKSGSTLEVGPNTLFDYGFHGHGILALEAGANFVMGNGSELMMNGLLVLRQQPESTTQEDMYVTLSEGAKLTFAKGSRINNTHSVNSAMRLVVTLDGGQVDLSGLNAIDREKVMVITLPKEDLAELLVLGNPATNELVISVASRNAGSLSLRCLNAMGQLVKTTSLSIAKGDNFLRLPIAELGQGTYVVEARIAEESRLTRFVKH
jgi:hypothetical protein